MSTACDPAAAFDFKRVCILLLNHTEIVKQRQLKIVPVFKHPVNSMSQLRSHVIDRRNTRTERYNRLR